MPADAFIVTDWSQPRSCYSVLVEPSTMPLLTVEEGKLRAGLSWAPGDPRDTLMTDWIRAAQQKVEEDTGLALLTQVRDVFIHAPVGAYYPLPSQCTPTQTVEDVGAGVLRVTAGWLNPENVRTQAPLLYQAVGLLVAHWATIGRDLAITGAVASVNIIPEGYAACIEPHRLIWVP